MPFNNAIPGTMSMDGTIPNITVDQAQYMAPMDLYDSIWGGEFCLAWLGRNPD